MNGININGPAILRIAAFVEALTVPEPGSALLQAFGLATLWGLRRARSR